MENQYHSQDYARLVPVNTRTGPLLQSKHKETEMQWKGFIYKRNPRIKVHFNLNLNERTECFGIEMETKKKWKEI